MIEKEALLQIEMKAVEAALPFLAMAISHETLAQMSKDQSAAAGDPLDKNLKIEFLDALQNLKPIADKIQARTEERHRAPAN